jgi:hypothetical protein
MRYYNMVNECEVRSNTNKAELSFSALAVETSTNYE